MTLRSISATAAWICRKARPAGVEVSMGELSARNPTPRWSSSSARGARAGRGLGLRRGAGGVVLEHTLAASGVQGVELSVEDLVAFGGGDAGVADDAHGVCVSRQSSSGRPRISEGSTVVNHADRALTPAHP